ncbi:cysteine hydrolase family protein [Rhizobium ruizarguesonis]|uniref:Cysteine hydrolase n=1 Tax=Rhizobium ruizarguesonis TaxID=2081791 RepID=A0AB38HZK9_9HYPH|nr:cysteine hydrolase family protein [Rhizobium ruizarguesonis]NEI30437.1 isochorismatase family protein [Rhizobium ruizarguesonis]NEJ94661.1 isochorismatase family protein [Rhizobium ruizarguesonis]TAY94263.1 cysteine hydrolase [Rhizobium ruizarguesonis]TAZ78657.1 cysteine hydrolase [Rhizobium ruizarguesonis]TBA05039.1 cysteine hydrolase [Rhizobium ruizarguesonis]
MTKALLIIDVQNAILSGKASPERQPDIDAALDETVARLAALQEKARRAGAPIVLVQHDGDSGHRLAVGTPGWALRDEITPRQAEVVVRKKSADSFFETDLAERLGERSVTHLVVGGCMSQFCVDTTVRRAVSLGYDVTLIADGHTTGDTATFTFSEIIAHHNETLDGLDAGKATVEIRPAAEIDFS